MNFQDKIMLGKSIGTLRSQIFRLQRIRYAGAAIRLTVEEAILLNMINEKTNQILQNIALVTGKNKSVVMRMIDSLEKKGLIVRSANPEDRREKLLQLTDNGKKLVKENQQIEKLLTSDLLQGIPTEDVQVFLKVFNDIGHNANKLLLEE